MPGKEATASRRGGSAGIRSNRARRLDGRAWRDVSRAIHLGKKKDLYSVEVHGVRAVFKKSAPHIVENSRRTSKPGMPASRQHVDPASAPTANLPRPPNSAKRRSARRMQNHIKELQGTGSQKATTHPKTTTPKLMSWSVRRKTTRVNDSINKLQGKHTRGICMCVCMI